MASPTNNEPPSVASILQTTPGQPQSPSAHASGFDNLTCQWQNCGERCTSAEALYEHVCERHVGRKSTNNLNLQCQWGSCRTTTVKRDHITSHIRVHVPLKPHRCDFCGKSFKRPQDLKKHVKTHAEDNNNVMNARSPGGQGADPRGGMSGFPQGPRDAGMYGGAPPPQPGYGYPAGTAAQAQMSNGNYGPVYYNMPQNGGFGLALTEQRKRAHDSLDAFFGDVKRRQFDPTQYVDLGSHFGGMGLFNDAGYNNGYHNQPQSHGFGSGGTATATMTAPPIQDFDVNFTNLKTKNDLQSIDAFLEQLQKTVYEHSSHVVRRPEVGVGPSGESLQQPTYGGVLDPSLDRRPSPPESFSATTSTTGDHTSGLTPGSQLSSHSPASAHSQQPHMNVGYPSLPNPVTMGQHENGGYMQHTSGPPQSGLGDAYEGHDRIRRHSGGYLQRAKPSSPRESEVAVDGAQEEKSPAKENSGQVQTGQAENGDGSGQDDRLEGWVQNMRTIETLRKIVHSRIAHGQFEAEGSPTSDQTQDGNTTPKADQQTQDYPMEDVNKAVAYPSLPRAAQSS